MEITVPVNPHPHLLALLEPNNQTVTGRSVESNLTLRASIAVYTIYLSTHIINRCKNGCLLRSDFLKFHVCQGKTFQIQRGPLCCL